MKSIKNPAFKYIPIGIVAQMAGVCTMTVNRWDLSNTLKPAFRNEYDQRLYDISEVRRFIAKRERERKKRTHHGIKKSNRKHTRA